MGLRLTYLIRILVVACLCIFSYDAFAQVQVTAELDSNSILIGEQVKLKLSISYSAEGDAKQIRWPDIKDTLIKEIEVVNFSQIDTSIKDRDAEVYRIEQSRILTLTSFDSGYYAIPPFQFILNNDTNKPFLSEALLLEVNTVPVDTSLAIRDIKPPIDEPFDFREILPYLGWGALTLAVLVALIYFLTRYLKNKKKKPAPAFIPKTPPHITALSALEKLKEEKLWQEGNYKQYHSKISEILRTYIEHRFSVFALEQTTEEILQQFKHLVVASEYKDQLHQVLALADLVKFAKVVPIASENEQAMDLAFKFVNGTKKETIDKEKNKDV